MGALRTLVLGLSLSCGLLGPATGMTAQGDLLKQFAYCAGRLSALMEHQWMFDGPASDETKRTRAQMIDLMSAVMPPGQGREALNWRIEAKLAYAALLQQASFAEDKGDRLRAKRLSVQHLQHCKGMLLS